MEVVEFLYVYSMAYLHNILYYTERRRNTRKTKENWLPSLLPSFSI